MQIQLLKKKENTGIFEGDIIFNFRFYFLLFFKYVIPFDGEAQEKDEEITSSNADTVAIGTNSDDTDSDLSPLPTEEILLSQVTDEMKEEVNVLKQIFVQESKNEKLGSVLEISKLAAQEYADKLSTTKKAGLKTGYNLNSLKIGTQGISISRKDSRVSYEILTLKVNIDSHRLSVEHQESKTARKRKKFVIDFQDLLGMKMENSPSSLILDCKTFTTSEKNLTEESIRAKWMNETKCLPSNKESFHRVCLCFNAVSDISLFVKLFEFSPVMTTVLARGIQRKYDIDKVTNVSSADFPKFFPVFVDPLLSYAAFLAAIEIQREFMEDNNTFHSKDDEINKIKEFVRKISASQCVFEQKLTQRNDKSKV